MLTNFVRLLKAFCFDFCKMRDKCGLNAVGIATKNLIWHFTSRSFYHTTCLHFSNFQTGITRFGKCYANRWENGSSVNLKALSGLLMKSFEGTTTKIENQILKSGKQA